MNEKQKKSGYWPLISLILIAALAAAALHWTFGRLWRDWMQLFMGFFLCQFAMLKIFTPTGFADGFQMYDILAKRSRIYAYIYPLIELALGLAYLAFFLPWLTYSVTAIVMFFGAVGVVQALMRGLDINCPCMGSQLNVPLSTVTLIEDVAMGALSIMMLIFYF